MPLRNNAYMKILKHLLIYSFLLFATGVLHAQDIHWTQFTMSPLTLNPAFTGDFEGTFRIGGIYRDQYNFVSGKNPGGKGFRTPSFFVDVPIIMIRKRDWVSAGIVAYADKAGSGGLTNSGYLASGSYHLSLDKKSTRYLVAGIQFGSVTREIKDREALTFADNILDGTPGSSSTDFNKIPTDGKGYSVTNFGLMYRAATDKKTNMNIGLAVSYITRPDGGITTAGAGATGSRFKRPLKTTFHGQMERKINDKLTIYPAFIFQNSAKVNEIAVQAMGGYALKFKDLDLQAKAGLGYRVGDAVQLLIGAHYDDWQFGLAYDLTASGLTSSNSARGGFELAINKIIKIYKQPTVPPVIFCPDL